MELIGVRRSCRRFWVAGVVVILVASGLSGGTVRRPPGAEPAGPPLTAAPDAAVAAQVARVQGARVEALDQRTEMRAVFAEPDGTMTAELSAQPVRVRQGDAWTNVDTTLVRHPDGTVGPRAAAVDLVFSGGGSAAPLATYGKDGKRITFTWPGELPAPSLSGDTATYAGVLPGVDLTLRADVDGYAQHLVVKTAEAAKNPAVSRLRLGLRADGLRIRETPAGGLEAVDAAGAVAFAAPPSQMWDSSPSPRRAVARVGVDGGWLTVTPDPVLLADPATVYPVTVDPDWATFGWIGWTSVLSGLPNSAHWNGSADSPWAQVGNCGWSGCAGIGTGWSYFQFNTGFLAGTQILRATLDTVIVHGPQCGAWRDHQLYIAHGQIGPGTTWNNRPGGGLLDTRGVDNVHAGCADWKAMGFDTHGSIHINDAGGISTYFIKASDDGDRFAWRKFDSNQTRLVVNFNRIPNPPYNLTTQPSLAACANCGGVPYVGDDTITLQTNLSDNDPGEIVHPIWHIFRDNVQEDRDVCPCQVSGSVFTTSVDLQSLDRKRVKWGVQASDGRLGSEWRSGPKEFIVDRRGVGREPGLRTSLYKADNRWHGGVDVPDTFTFTADGFTDVHGVNDIDHYLWGTTYPPRTRADANGLGGDATVTFRPTVDGPQDLYVQMFDRAGHPSPIRTHHFYVRAGSGPLAQWAFDGNANDEAYLGDRHGTLAGNAAYLPGPVGSAIRFDGTPGTHMSAPNAVHTDTSFSVSAWVRLEDSGSFARAAVSQDGTNFAGFDLWYRPENGGKWVFGMANSDASYQGADTAWSAAPAQRNTWTHLTGVYDAPARLLRLYVNGVLAGTAARTVPSWDATGPVRIGQTMWNGDPDTDFWPGRIDEVALYDRVLSAAEVRSIVGRDNVQAGSWAFDETTGTTARNAVDGGEMMVLANGASFTQPAGAVQFNTSGGDDDYAATSGPVVRTDQSFSVTAWVKPAAGMTPGNTLTALSQEGGVHSGFLLGYRNTTAGNVWELVLPSADTGLPRPGDDILRSTVPAQLGVWTHLAAVYDASTRDVRLYVNGQLAGSAVRANGFHAAGPLTLGRGKWEGNQTNPWVGTIDEVRAYTRELSQEEVRGILARSTVTLGSWRLNGDAADSSGRGLNGTPTGGPDWTGGQTAMPDPGDLALQLKGDGAHVSAPNTVDVRQSFSVSAWAKLDRTATGAAVVSQDAGRVSAFNLHVARDGKWVNAMRSCTASWVCTESRAVGPVAQVGVWTHLVTVYDAGAGQLSIYVNGVLAGTQSYRHTWNQAGGRLLIGRATWGNTEPVDFFPGAIDDVDVYGRVLFAEEIRVMAGRDLSLVHNWPLDEPSGTRTADAVGARAGVLAGGVAHVPGRLGNALGFDAAGEHVATTGVDVDARRSFTVATWVYLRRICDPGGSFSCGLTAASLDGGQISKFRLGHLVDQDQNQFGAWVFEMPEANGTVTKAAVSALESDLNAWVHLVGVYDAPARQIWLYVNGTRQGDGTLNTPWAASGGLVLGRGLVAGAPAEHWPGEVDDVRLYAGTLDKTRIAALHASYPVDAGTPALPAADTGRWTFGDSVGSTAAADSSGRGHPATLAGGAELTGWTVRLNGTSAYAETAGPVLTTNQSFTVTAWAYMNQPGGGNRTIVAQDGNQVSAFLLGYRADSGRWAVVVPTVDQNNPATVTLASATPAWYGDWVQLAVAYDAPLRQLRLHVNGVLSAAAVDVTVLASSGKFTIGRHRWNGAAGGFFSDEIHDVRVFGRALRDAEVRKVHDDKPPSLHGSYRFDDGTARDHTWRHNDATVSGGASFVAGLSGRSLQLDGASGAATAIWSGIPMRDSFAVSAWARLAAKNHDATILGQDGNRLNGFVLQYRRDIDRWVFGIPAADSDGAALAYAYSPQPAEVGHWTHLTGLYDHAARQLRLYVNGVLVGTRSGVTAWPAGGPLSIGRGRQAGQPADFFAGTVDEVLIDKWLVPDAEIALRGGWPAPAPGQFGRFVNPSTGDRSVDNTSGPVSAGYRFDGSLGVPVPPGPNTRMLYACHVWTDRFLSTDPACDGFARDGEAGLVYTEPPTNVPTVPLYKCWDGASDSFPSRDPACEGALQFGVLGYALAYAALPRYVSASANDHLSTTYGTPPGYRNEGGTWLLSMVPRPGTQPLLSCLDGTDHYLSLNTSCDGTTVVATIGEIWATAPAGLASAPVFQCHYTGRPLTTRFLSLQADCEGNIQERRLGYLLTALPTTTPVFS